MAATNGVGMSYEVPLLLCLLLWVVGEGHCDNLFKNADFEDANSVFSWGHAWGYRQDIVMDATAKSGTHYMRVYNRTETWQGPGQDVGLRSNTSYQVRCWIKVLNRNSKLFQGIRWTVSYQWHTDSQQKTYHDVAARSMLNVSSDWINLSGDFTTPATVWNKTIVYIQGPDPGIDFLVDDASLTIVPQNLQWKTEADRRIEQIRKHNFSISVDLPPEYDPSHTEVEIKLTKHEFGFGSVTSVTHILDQKYSKGYHDTFYRFFNWATVGDFKWRYNRGTLENPNYDDAVNTVKVLKSHGLKVRGHNMFWGVKNFIPNEVRNMNSTQLKSTIDERIRYMTSLTKGLLDHWDVNNELLHGQEFEEKTRDPNYSMKIYTKVHNADPYPKLFLNEYDVVAVGSETADYLNQAIAFKTHSHLDALGVQSHFADNTAPNPTLIKKRLDLLAKANLPIWVTEMTVSNKDEHARADWIENALRIYFSHPSVRGVILWGFWDENGQFNQALVNGNYFSINQAGTRYLQLLENEWSTNVKWQLSNQHETRDIRGYLGDYDVIVRYYGNPIMLYRFSNTKHTTQVHVTVPSGNHIISLPTSRPTDVSNNHTHHVTSQGKHVIGHSSSGNTPHSSHCVSRYSTYSQIGDDKTVTVSCSDDEVMTACMMLTIDRLHFRDGEKFVSVKGKISCMAVNAWRSTAPVQAIARCCRISGLQCDYLMAGPAGQEPEDQIEVKCNSHQFALGCGSYTYYGQMDGSFTKSSSCIAQNDGTKGVFVSAACCSALHLSCTVRKSAQSALQQGSNSSVVCHQGEHMTGCSVYTEDGSTAGSVIRDNADSATCYAFNGYDKFPGEMGVIAYATCCSVTA